MSEAQEPGKNRIRPFVLWFTGLPSSGKTTLAQAVVEYLRLLGAKVEQLDGDEVRAVFPTTGFSREERNQHIKRIGFLAQRLERNGINVVASFVSPYSESRDAVRAMCQNFIEVYLSTGLTECERRDVKGLYQKARRGEVASFTGVSDPYEVPASAEIVINTAGREIDDCVKQITEYLRSKELIGGGMGMD